MEKPNVLLLDEPTNDLDIATLTVLENFLQGFAGPVLTVSHDRYFLDKVATKILAFEDGKIRPFFGHYTDYLDEKAFETDMVNQVQKVEKEKVVKVREDKKRMTYQEKQEWASIEGDIETLEKRIAAIEEEMQANGSDFGKLATLKKNWMRKMKHSLKNTNAMSISVNLIVKTIRKSKCKLCRLHIADSSTACDRLPNLHFDFY